MENPRLHAAGHGLFRTGLAWALDILILIFLALLLGYVIWGRPSYGWASGLDFPCLTLAGLAAARWGTGACRTPLQARMSGVLEGILLRVRGAADRPNRLLALSWVISGLGFLGFTAYSLANHYAYGTSCDLGLYAQALWTFLHGDLFYSSIHQHCMWAAHFEPILIPIAGLYAVFSHPATLLVLEALGLALAGPALYLLAQRRLPGGHRALGLGLALIYFCHPAVWGMIRYPFHPISLGVPLWIWFFHLVRGGPRGRAAAWCLAAAALCCGEPSWAVLAGYGLHLALGERRRAYGAVILSASLAGSLVMLKLVVPYFNPGRAYIFVNRFSDLGGSLGEIVGNVIGNPLLVLKVLTMPGKITYLLVLLGSVLFAPLARPASLLLVAPPVLLIMLSSFRPQWGFDHHYGATVVPGLFFAAALGLGRLARLKPLARLSPRLALVFFLIFPLLLLDESPVTRVRQWLVDEPACLSRVVERIGPHAGSLALPPHLISHFPNRYGLFLNCMFPRGTPLVVLSTQDRWPLSQEELRAFTTRLIQDQGYVLDWREGGCAILRYPLAEPVQRKGRALKPLLNWISLSRGS